MLNLSAACSRAFLSVFESFNRASEIIEIIDTLGDNKTATYSGPDSFGTAAELVAEAPLPGDLGKEEVIELMGFSSGVTTASGEAVIGLAELVKDPVGQGEQMLDLAGYFADNPKAIEKIPEMMIDGVATTRDQRNPFNYDPEKYDFASSWSVGYLTGMAIPELLSGGTAGTAAQIAARSNRLRRTIQAVSRASSVAKSGVSMPAVITAGKISARLPNVDTGPLINKISDVSAPGRQRVAVEMRRLDEAGITESNVYQAAGRATTLIKQTGAAGRRSLNALSAQSRSAADTLLRLHDDVATQQVLTGAYARGDISASEMASTLRKYDSYDQFDRADIREMILTGGDEAVASLSRTSDDALDNIVTAEASTAERVQALRTLDAVDNRETVEDLITTYEFDSDATGFVARTDADALDDILGSCGVGTSQLVLPDGGVVGAQTTMPAGRHGVGVATLGSQVLRSGCPDGFSEEEWGLLMDSDHGSEFVNIAGEDGSLFLAETDKGTLDTLFNSDALSARELAVAGQRFADLDADRRDIFRSSLGQLEGTAQNEIVANLASASDAETFTDGLNEIQESADVDVGEYYDGDDAVPTRAKGRIVEVVGDSERSASDAIEAKDALQNLEGVSDSAKTRFVDDGGTESVQFLSEVDQDTIEDVLSVTVDTSGTQFSSDLQDRVRVAIAQSYSREYFSLHTDGRDRWPKQLYPNVEEPSDVAREIVKDIDTLESSDGIDGEVKGLARTLSKSGDGGSGAYLDRLPDPRDYDEGDPSTPVKGVALELRTARQAAEDLDAGETLKMSANPVNDLSEVSSDNIDNIAERIGISEEQVETALSSSRGEFDAIQVVSNGNGGRSRIYLESKNTRTAPSADALQRQASRFFADQIEDGAEMEDLKMTVVTRTEDIATTLNTQIDSEWFSARASSTEVE